MSLDKTLTQYPGPAILNMPLGTNWANVELGKREIQRAFRIHGIQVGNESYFVGNITVQRFGHLSSV